MRQRPVLGRVVETRGSMARLSALDDVPISKKTMWVKMNNFRIPNLNEVKIGSVVEVIREQSGEYVVVGVRK